MLSIKCSELRVSLFSEPCAHHEELLLPSPAIRHLQGQPDTADPSGLWCIFPCKPLHFGSIPNCLQLGALLAKVAVAAETYRTKQIRVLRLPQSSPAGVAGGLLGVLAPAVRSLDEAVGPPVSLGVHSSDAGLGRSSLSQIPGPGAKSSTA